MLNRERALTTAQSRNVIKAVTALLVVSVAGLAAGCGYGPDPQIERDAKHGSVLSVRHVESAVAYYDEHGLQSTVDRYTELWQDGNIRYVMIYDIDGTRVFDPYAPADGPAVTDYGRSLAEALVDVAANGGGWFSLWFPNPLDGAVERKHIYAIEHDGLVFAVGYYPSRT